MKGVQNAQGDVIVFLQMPFEVNVNWLPPLLDPLVEDKDAVTCPLIDSIGTKTRQAAKIQNGERKGFNWRFQPVNFGRSQADKSVLELPYTSPLLEEKAFAIHKTHYLEIEASILSPQWRGVDIELSLKTWLCGGKILNVPCSRIGSFSKPPRGSVTDHDAQNYRIIAHQWFEDYGKFVLSEIGRGETLSPETEDSMLDIWESLTCKPFRWFLEKVMPELLKQFPPYIPAPKLGVIQNNVCRKCVSVPFAHQDTTLVMLQSCKNSETALNYHVHLLNDGHIRLSDGKQCLSLTDFGGVVYSPCSDLERQQIWLYNSDTQTLMNEHTERCLEATVRCDRAYFPSCNQVRPKPKKSRTWLIAKDQSQLKPELNKTEIDEMKQKRKRQIHLA
ncbi:N-acetylgalactosaminyltransferase 4-like [Liolophura sinensis]|uniref:N-acetylgalactosaminyltransferase 4-like n=1 Tax=Liolophura sinensis TaxID=3198878 RepID=UPI00315945BB